jgi:uncharacterized protein YqcC (DUF446 family)
MRQHRLWSDQSPSLEGYSSLVPFAADYWRLEQWLQFVFIPKIRRILERDQVLPERCAVGPMVASPGCGGADLTCLEAILKTLDEAIEQAP